MESYEGADAIERAWRDGLTPDPLLTVSQWADRYRVLSQRASSEPGRWRTERTPYLKEIMDCLSPSSPYQRVVFMKGAQIGGMECGNNFLAFVIHQAPGPMMAVSPTVELAKRNSKQRIDPLIEESERQIRERRDTGLPLDGLPDLASGGERDGFYQTQLIRELAVRHITTWTGVELEGGPAPPTPENIAAVMELYPVGERFFQEFTLPQVLLNAEKKRIRALCRWHFQPGKGSDYCRACRDDAPPAPGASPEPMDGPAPNREHALISRQEHEI